ncbi:TPA: hypothetical protein ACYX6Q_000624 [Klebsiella variicola]|jgi:hypothetical protein
MVATVGEFQMPARVGRAEHNPAESFMIGKAAELLKPQPGAIHAGGGVQFTDRSGNTHMAEQHNGSRKQKLKLILYR